jgi:shikimate dehydrogenase
MKLIGRQTQLCMSLAARPGNFGSRFHNHLYQALGLDYLYKAFTTTDLGAAIGGIRALGIRGCALSMPFKEACIPLLDALAPSAQAIDSVNTVVNDGGRLCGHNTDYLAVRTLLDSRAAGLRTAAFVLRGSGGMAKAVAAALRDSGFTRGRIVSRNAVAGRALAARYGFVWAEGGDGGGLADLLINATPLGMAGGDPAALPFSDEQIAGCQCAFDVVAMPEQTPLLQCARDHGRATISGAEVIVLQAVEQFVLYTGVRPEPAAIAAAAQFARANP